MVGGTMIRNTFIILPKVGLRRELTMWRGGVLDWSDFIGRRTLKGFSPGRKSELDRCIGTAEDFLTKRESAYFTSLLPTVEHWRLFETFKDDSAYLDIETDGLGAGAVVTVVSVHRAGRTTTLVRGRDLSSDALGESLRGVKMLVTYNGASFDLPRLHKEFPFTVPRVPHFDLRHGCGRLGWKGGLKEVERRLGIERPREVEFVTGEQAVYLWHLWERKGSENALKLLVRYNIEDTRNLEEVARKVHHGLVLRTREAMGHGE
jgi:uncharacterized protein YprB with RNaseH-like and TPR domain